MMGHGEPNNLKIVAIAPTSRKAGGTFYSKKLYSRLPAKIIAAESPAFRLVNEVLMCEGNIYHIQFEYRVFGSFVRSLLMLVFLSIILSLRRPVVVTLHGVLRSDSVEGRIRGRVAYFSYLTCIKLTAIFTKGIIIHTALMREVLEHNYHIRKGTVIPQGTDPAPFDFSANRGSRRLVFYGFIRPSKGLDKLILAVDLVRERYPDVQLTIGGGLARPEESPYLQYLQQIIRERSLLGYVELMNRTWNQDEKKMFFSQAATIVLPYTDRFIESSGVVHDLAGYGLPLICTRTPRFSELVDGFDCLKVNPTANEIANAILKLFGNPEFGVTLANNLRSKVSHESWDVVANEHLELYRNILGRRVIA